MIHDPSSFRFIVTYRTVIIFACFPSPLTQGGDSGGICISSELIISPVSISPRLRHPPYVKGVKINAHYKIRARASVDCLLPPCPRGSTRGIKLPGVTGWGFLEYLKIPIKSAIIYSDGCNARSCSESKSFINPRFYATQKNFAPFLNLGIYCFLNRIFL
jgi:hypothetical protein